MTAMTGTVSQPPAGIDSRHRLWRGAPEDFGRFDGTTPALRRDFLPGTAAAAYGLARV